MLVETHSIKQRSVCNFMQTGSNVYYPGIWEVGGEEDGGERYGDPHGLNSRVISNIFWIRKGMIESSDLSIAKPHVQTTLSCSLI